MRKYLLIYWLLFFVSVKAIAQFDQLLTTIEKSESISTSAGREKIFIHYDKPQYQTNDTMWLKGYIVSGNNTVNDSSRIAYVEFIDARGTLLKRVSASCYLGAFYSNITLSDELFVQGDYTLRAYTERMRSFGDSLFFQAVFKVINPKAEIWKAKLNDLSVADGKLVVSAALLSATQQPMAGSRVTVALKTKNRTIFRKRMITDANGNMYIDTLLKKSGENKKRHLEIFNKELDLKIPLPDNNNPVDLQFLPEGGRFVAGYRQKLGFKALDIYGKGIDVQGIIKDAKGNEVASFESIYKGMGSVELTPLRDEIYTAYLKDGSAYTLPPAEITGCLLQVRYSDQGDSIVINVDINGPVDSIGYFITGSSRGKYFLKGRLRGRKKNEIKIPAITFPGGVVRFTLYDGEGNAVNERALFVWNDDDLKLQLTSDQPEYGNKERVEMSLTVRNDENEAVAGNFSVAILDTSQVPINVDAENIVSYMVLSADLKGTIETPYYFVKNARSKATDALMLTQGWVKYEWGDFLKRYEYEKEFLIKGRVTGMFDKAITGTTVSLFGRDGSKGFFLMDTVTNHDGYFYFRNFPLFQTDSTSMLIKAVNKKEKSFGIDVEIFNKDYPTIAEPEALFDRGSILFDTTARKLIDRRSAIMDQLKRDGAYMEEVVVTAKARIPGSYNLNEDGGADQTINKSMLEQIPKASLLEALRKHIPDFPFSRSMPFRIGHSLIKVLVDGILIDTQGVHPVDFLQSYAAEDVKGIEIMTSVRYTIPYQSVFNPQYIDFINPPIFVEITSVGGKGPFIKKIPGMYLLKPNSPFVGKVFYSPKYASPDHPTAFPDLRQTVYWNPVVLTDAEGTAKFSFYTSDSKGDYLIIVQGTDYNGGFGTLIAPLKIKTEKEQAAATP